MKKLCLVLVSIFMIASLAACGKEDAGKGGMNNGEKVWTVTKATYTNPSGMSSVCYTGELKNDSFIMSYLTERKKGEVNRDSMIFQYDANGISKIIEEGQDYGKDVERGEEMTLTYDEATSTLTRLSTEDGRETSKKVYVITWDDEGRISEYTQTNYYYDYKEDGSAYESDKYEYKYTYSYGDDSYTITCDEESEVTVGTISVDAIWRVATTIPYDEKGDITTVRSYVELDGKTPLYTGSGDVRRVNEVIVSNWWGYEISNVTNYSDGTSKKNEDTQFTFDKEGKIIKIEEKIYKNGLIDLEAGNDKITVTTEFTYDDNGNLTKIKNIEEDVVSSIDFEWAQILPEKLDSQIAMLNGAPHWSVAEYIDNYIDFNWEGRLTVRTYKLSDFLSYVK